MTTGSSRRRAGRRSLLGSAVVVALAAVTFLPASASSASEGPRSARPVPARASSTRSDTASTLATPSATQVTKSCQLLSTARELGPTSTVPTDPVATVISPAAGVWDVASAAGLIYVVNGAGLSVYDDSGTLENQFSLPAGIVDATSGGVPVDQNGVSQPVVDPSGDVYISSYYGSTVVEIGTAGQVLDTFDPGGGNPTNIFALHSPTGAWELGVTTVQQQSYSYVYDSTGAPAGTSDLRVAEGGFVDVEAGNDILYAAGDGYVQTWDSGGNTLLGEFGSSSIHGAGDHTGGPLSFYYPDEAVRAAGAIYTADGLSTMTVTYPSGVLVGTTTLGGQTDFDGDLALDASNLVAQTGPPFDDASDTVSIIPIANVTSYLTSRQPSSNLLGWGAGLRTGVPGNYFRPGSTPSVTASFDPWWTSLAPHLELGYEIWDSTAINAGRPPAESTVPLPDTSTALADIPIPLGPQAPGPYEIQVRLLDTSSSPPRQVGATCMPYAVAAPGDRLDFATLPGRRGTGGPTDPRGVVLDSQLGLDGVRSLDLVNWASLLPDCNSAAPSASTCGPGALRLGRAPTAPYRAAALAVADHIHYWMQVSGGDPISLALVDDRLWRGDIQALVNHYSHVPSGCQDCAPVTEWEPWNEPNNTGWSDPQQYVTEVLEPFYNGVKAVEPDATVIGGSSLEVDLPWWQGLIAAGGLDYLDVASAHPYPGNDDSWEEDGMEGQLSALKAALGDVPLWLTEVGWWSDGGYDFTQQADLVTRAEIWQKLIGIPVWNYFFNEGSYGNDGISFSLIQAADGANIDDYVKPAALAVMEESRQIAGRAVIGQPPSGIPQTWDARFGKTKNGTTDTAAVWSDGLTTTAALSATGDEPVPVTLTDQYGATTSVTLQPGTRYALGVSDQVEYIDYPDQDHIKVTAPVAYGTDLALVSSGATATASSGDATAALVDPTDATGYGEGWASASTDPAPTLTVTLAQPETINRVVVDTQAVGSVAPGLRNYTVDVETTSGAWRQVAAVVREFRDHSELLAFDPVEAEAVMVTVTMVNVGGYYGGGLPYFCTVAGCPPLAFVHAVEIYAGAASPAQVTGANLKRL